jgi:hypothetical protein
MALVGAFAAHAQTRIWSISLETVGWVDPYKQMIPAPKQPVQGGTGNPHFRAMREIEQSAPRDWDLGPIWSQQLVIDPSGQIIVGFGNKGEGPAKAKVFHVVTLDGKTGTAMHSLAMPTPVLDRTAVLLNADGSLLVVAGDRVQQIKADGAAGNSVPIPPQPDMNPRLRLRQSPSGKTLVMTTDDEAFRFIRTDTLATLADCRTKNDEVEVINDTLGLSMEDTKGPYFDLHAGPFCGPMRKLWTLSSDRSSSVHLLEDGTLLEIGVQSVRRLTSNDKALWTWKASGALVVEDVGGSGISRDGSRLAVQLTAFKMLHSPGCMECTGPESESWIVGVVVLDASTGKLVTTIPLDHANQNRLAVAFSPDGKKIAILNGGVLELWAL